MINSIESPTISNKDVELLLHDIDQPVDWKKNKCKRGLLHKNTGCFDGFANPTVFFQK